MEASPTAKLVRQSCEKYQLAPAVNNKEPPAQPTTKEVLGRKVVLFSGESATLDFPERIILGFYHTVKMGLGSTVRRGEN